MHLYFPTETPILIVCYVIGMEESVDSHHVSIGKGESRVALHFNSYP